MTEPTLDEQMQKLETYEKGFLAVHLVNIGVQLGIFDNLKAYDSGITSKALATEMRLHEPYLRVWCQTAHYMEILDCDDDGKFRLAPHMSTLLTDIENPYYFGHRAKYMVSHTAEDLQRHPQFYRSGESHFYDAHGRDFSRDSKALTNHVVPLAYTFMIIPSIPGLKEGLDAGIRVLDVGCGAGRLMIQLAQTYPNCRFVGIEVDPYAVEEAQESIKRSKMEDKVSAMLVDATNMEYYKEFDVVNLAVALHEVRPAIRRRAMENCYKALKNSGQILILDFAYPQKAEDFRKPEYAPGIKDQFYEATWGSEHLPLAERHKLLLEAGFKNPTTISLFGGPIEVTCAQK